MKTVKKLLAVVLCTALLFSFCLVQAEETEEVIVYGTEYYEILNALGVTDYNEADLASNMTRAEFYKLVAKLGGYPSVKNVNVVFADMTPANEYEPYTRTLYKLGMIVPDANGNVYPDKEITPTEAAALIVKILGYSPVAESKGGYPAGYLSMAGTLGLLDEVSANSKTLTKGEAVTMAYAALECDIMSQSMGANGGAGEYKVQKDVTLLESALGVELIEGVVNGVDITRVFGENDVRPFYIEVDEREVYVEDLYIENLTEPYEFLGYDVRVYATETRGYGTAALYIEKTPYNKEYIFDVEDITEIGSASLEAYTPDGKKTKNYRFKKAVPLVYNGIATGLAFNKALIEGKTGTVKLVDNTGDGTADVIFADIYENVVASYVDMSKMVVYSEADPERKVNINNDADDPYVMIFDSEGAEIGASGIKKGNVLSVFESAFDAGQPFSKIYVSNITVTGEIETIEDEDEIIVNGKIYEILPACILQNSNLIKIGTSVTMYLDIFGKVAYMEATKATEYTLGFLVAAGSESGLDSKLKFKICTAPEEYIEAYAATNVRVDDIRFKNTDSGLVTQLKAASKKMFPSSKDENLTSSFIRFALNANGEVAIIDTLMHDKETLATRDSYLTDKNCMYAVHQESAYHRRSGNHSTIGNGVVLNSATMLFGYPDLNDDTVSVFNDEMYSYGKFTSEVINNTTVKETWAVYTSAEQIVCNLVLQPCSKKQSEIDDENAYFAIVKKLSEMVDPEDETKVVGCITFMTNTGEVRIPVDKEVTFAGLPIPDEANGEVAKDESLVGTPANEGAAPGTATKLTTKDLKQGDIVTYTTNYRGYLSEIIFYYRPQTDAVITTSGYFGVVTSKINWYKGYVYDTYPEGFFFYTSEELTGDMEKDREILENVTMKDCQFVYYTAYTSCSSAGVDFSVHNENLRVNSKSMNNLKSYKETGDDCTYGILQRYYTYPRMFIAIEGLND